MRATRKGISFSESVLSTGAGAALGASALSSLDSLDSRVLGTSVSGLVSLFGAGDSWVTTGSDRGLGSALTSWAGISMLSGSGAASSGMKASSVGVTRGVLRRMTLRLRAAGAGGVAGIGAGVGSRDSGSMEKSSAHSSRDERGASGAGSSAGGSGSAGAAGAMRDCLRCWAICFQSWALAARASSSSPPEVGRCWN